MRRKPSLTSLRLFIQVAHNQSFSKTSRNANVSQSALSRTIQILEEQLGVRLFDRTSRRVVLTSAGTSLLQIAEHLTADFDQAFLELAQTLEGARGRVVIGALPSFAAGILPPIVAGFREIRPQVQLIVRDLLSGELYQQMKERQIDFAVTMKLEANEFVFEPLMRDTVVFVCRADSKLSGGNSISWSVFADHPFIAMAPRSSVRELTDAALAEAGVTARPLYECTQLATVGGLIEAGLGITALPQSTLHLLPSTNIASRQLVGPVVHRTIGIAYLADRTLSPAAAALLAHLRSEQAPPSAD